MLGQTLRKHTGVAGERRRQGGKGSQAPHVPGVDMRDSSVTGASCQEMTGT